MSVADKQIEELNNVLEEHVGRDDVDALLSSLERTIAYKRNQSFRQTIQKLVKLRREKDARRGGDVRIGLCNYRVPPDDAPCARKKLHYGPHMPEKIAKKEGRYGA